MLGLKPVDDQRHLVEAFESSLYFARQHTRGTTPAITDTLNFFGNNLFDRVLFARLHFAFD